MKTSEGRLRYPSPPRSRYRSRGEPGAGGAARAMRPTPSLRTLHRSMPPAPPPQLRRGPRVATLLLALLVCACGGPGRDAGPPVVAVSVLPQRTFVERIAGDRVRAVALIPPGASPASHEPTLADLRTLDRAILFVKVGHPAFPFEQAWLGPLLAERPELPVIGWSGASADDEDPHVWLSPGRVRELCRAIELELGRLLPEHADEFAANRRAFEAELDALDAELRRLLAPRQGHRFLVLHPAWGHLASDYGLVQWSIERHGKKPDAATLAHLIEEARAARVATLFTQPQFDPAPAELLAQEIGARTQPLDPLAADWAPNLSAAARTLAAGAVP